jgi:hypothetical protein
LRSMTSWFNAVCGASPTCSKHFSPSRNSGVPPQLIGAEGAQPRAAPSESRVQDPGLPTAWFAPWPHFSRNDQAPKGRAEQRERAADTVGEFRRLVSGRQSASRVFWPAAVRPASSRRNWGRFPGELVALMARA